MRRLSHRSPGSFNRTERRERKNSRFSVLFAFSVVKDPASFTRYWAWHDFSRASSRMRGSRRGRCSFPIQVGSSSRVFVTADQVGCWRGCRRRVSPEFVQYSPDLQSRGQPASGSVSVSISSSTFWPKLRASLSSRSEDSRLKWQPNTLRVCAIRSSSSSIGVRLRVLRFDSKRLLPGRGEDGRVSHWLPQKGVLPEGNGP